MRKLWAVMDKEARFMRRDPVFLLAQLVFPPLLLIVFGSVFSITLRRVPVAVQDLEDTPASRRLVRQLTATGYFKASTTMHPGESLDRGDSIAALAIPFGYHRKLIRGEDPEIEALVDGSDGSARSAEGYLAGLASRRASPAAGDVTPDHEPAASVSVAIWYNPEQNDAAFFVPGVIALLVFGAPTIFTSMSVVREKVSGTWTVLGAAPVGDLTLLAGKLLPYVLESALVTAILLAQSRLVFHLPFRGPLTPLLLGTFLFVLAGIGVGGVISSISSDEGDAWRYVLIFAILPSLVLSGFLYPLSSVPRGVQLLSRLFPVRPYLELVRAVLLKGAGTELVAPQLETLAAFAVGTLLVALVLLEGSRRPAS
jgi:ABC-2 type transport system permease protein